MKKVPALRILSIISIMGLFCAFIAIGKNTDFDPHPPLDPKYPFDLGPHSHLDHPHWDNRSSSRLEDTIRLVTGQGDFIFSWDKTLTAAFPEKAREHEPDMHGGFNEDPETGIVYTGIPGYGLCAISPDLQRWTKLGTDERLKDNIHGITFFVHKGKKHLAVAQNGKRVLVLNLDGTVVSDLVKPRGVEFDFPPANEFFSSEESNFGVTDVTYLDGLLYVAHGYSDGDFILTIEEKDGSWTWGSLAWGGKGDAPGQFQTAHGVFAHDDHVLVANRAAGQVVRFTKEGRFVEMFKDIPENSLVCNVSFKDKHFFFNALKAIGDMKSAPIYAHTGEKLVSTIIPGELEIPVLDNIHHVWPHVIKSEDGSTELYLLVHGWNKGKYAVLKME